MASVPVHANKIRHALEAIENSINVDIRYDDVTRLLYASDASIVQMIPLAVIYPKFEQDCISILNIAIEFDLPLIPRAAGTSLAGQVVGEAVILDFSRYMTNIISINNDEKYAIVQPGVIVSELNQALVKSNLMFAPDPSTLTRATISGLIGNNAWGAHSPLYGDTLDNVISLKIALVSGEVIEIQPLGQNELIHKRENQNREAILLNSIIHLLEKNKNLLTKQFPIKNVPNNVGYALDKLIRHKPWNMCGEDFNLLPLICGSEGTLGLITEIKIRLVPTPHQRLMMVVNFENLSSAIDAVLLATQYHAISVELLDEVLLSLISETKMDYHWLDSKAKALLIIEFQGKSIDELKDKFRNLSSDYRNKYTDSTISSIEGSDVNTVWNLRRSALGMLMGKKGNKKAVTFIEDSAVAVEHLSAFVSDIQGLMQRLDVDCVYYGSVSRGLVHLRPMLDLKQTSGRSSLNEISNEVLKILKKYSGSLSAKHGDGLVRGQHIEAQVGKDIYHLMREIKHIFDPKNILNPGKLFDSPVINQRFREGQITSDDTVIETYFNWEQQGGIVSAVEKCNGAAVCRRRSGGAMCPSFQATLEEKDSTRGRANIFRHMLTGDSNNILDGLSDERLHEVLKLCLACKACVKDCPAGVNMAQLKSEHLQHYYKKHATPHIVQLLSILENINAVASIVPNLSNKLLEYSGIKSLLSIHPNRSLPYLERTRLSHWFRSGPNKEYQNKTVILLNDVFNEFYDVDIAKKAILSLRRLGYKVLLSPLFPSLRLLISQGMVQQAIKRFQKSIGYFYQKAIEGIPIIGLEPSELLTYRDEITSLVFEEKQKEQVKHISENMYLFDEFIATHLTEADTEAMHWTDNETTFFVHTHCHQKSLIGSQNFTDCLSGLTNMKIHEIQSGCCGMAGFFGYEKDNYDLSVKIANLNLFPEILKAPDNSIIVASGFSCRHQIMEGLNIKALHPAEIIYQTLHS